MKCLKLSGTALKLILLLCAAFEIVPVDSQTQYDIPVHYLGIENGLSNNDVTCIYQDKYGFMWFGTYDGLNKYDGYSFKAFRNRLNDSTSLINNRIVAIGEDQENNLWIGTKTGISLYSNCTSKFSSFYYYSYLQHTLKKIDNPINDIKTDRKGNVLIGTAGNALIVYRKSAKNAVQIPFREGSGPLIGYHVQAITFDESGRTWLFVQGKGLCIYDDRSGEVKLVNGQVLSGICLISGSNGKLWLGTENGLYEYDIRSGLYKGYNETTGKLSNNKVVHLCLDRKHNLWIATDGGGIDILDSKTGKLSYLLPGQYKKSLTSAAVYAVYEDKEGRKWIGTLRGGINIIDERRNRFTTISHDPLNPNSLINDFVLSFCEEPDGNIWIGTDGGGLSYWNRKSNSYTNFKHSQNNPSSLSSDFITSIVKDFQGNTWIATYGGGINRYNKGSHSFQHYSCIFPRYRLEDRNVWKLYEDRDKNLWAGTCTGGRLYLFNRVTNQFDLFDEKLTDVLSLFQDKNGVLWAGTFGELIKVDKLHKNHQHFETGNAVRSIYEDKAGVLWIGTEGSGLLQFDRKQNKFTGFTEENGLPGNSILNILEDGQHNLWMSTFNGISKLNTQRTSFKNFYESDGLQSNQFNYNAALITRSGEFLFGGIKGFNIFYPDNITLDNVMPNLQLTGIKIDNIPIEQSGFFAGQQSLFNIDKITLPYNKAAISIDFAALEYSAPDKIAYAYYLEGWDKGWNYVGKLRTANYSRLNEGHYILRIKSTNAEGAWNPVERTIYINVLPPWYRSWWAYSLYMLLFIAVIYCYLLYKNRQTRLHYEIRIARLHAEKEKELNEKKLSFFTNISHEFRTPLTLIINPVKEWLNHSEQTVDAGELTVVYRNARRLLSLVDQLLLFRKADSEENKLRVVKVNFFNLCKEVYLCFSQLARTKHIRYEFECFDENIELYVDREKIEIVLFNLLSNALKFTPEGGEVIFRLTETAAGVSLDIQDTGVGIPEGTGNKLFERFYQAQTNNVPFKTGFGIGLYIVKIFIDNHKGSISYESETGLGTGTTFHIQLLKGTGHFGSNTVFEEDTEENKGFLYELVEEPDEEVTDKSIPDLNEEQDINDANGLITDSQSMLVVEDNEQIRKYIVSLFRKDFKVYEADNGDDAFRLIKLQVPDIVISDVLMQGLSGIELCSKIKEDPSLNHIPVILLTASTSSEVKLKGIECGASDYITKPFEKEILMARVNSILKSRNDLQKYFYNEITLQENTLKISPENKDFLDKCIDFVELHLDDEEFNIKALAAEMGTSHSNLYKKVKYVSGQSLNGFIRFIRLRKAARLFINTECNVNEVAFQVGISDVKYFRLHFSKLFGMNPSAYIKKYRVPLGKNFKMNGKIIKPKNN
jgi:signal transduction histidine kinase/ligand-binding sensor domain-containing protein/DNA-binding response OmpR family regulator